MLNPGCVLQVRLMWGDGKERDWPGERGAQHGHRAGQVVVVKHQRPFLLGLHLLLLSHLLFLLLLLLTLQVDLGIVGKGEEG